jgi:hypothetical protein
MKKSIRKDESQNLNHVLSKECRRNKVRRNKNMPKFGKTAEFGAHRKNHLYGIVGGVIQLVNQMCIVTINKYGNLKQ